MSNSIYESYQRFLEYYKARSANFSREDAIEIAGITAKQAAVIPIEFDTLNEALHWMRAQLPHGAIASKERISRFQGLQDRLDYEKEQREGVGTPFDQCIYVDGRSIWIGCHYTVYQVEINHVYSEIYLESLAGFPAQLWSIYRYIAITPSLADQIDEYDILGFSQEPQLTKTGFMKERLDYQSIHLGTIFLEEDADGNTIPLEWQKSLIRVGK